MKNILIIQTAFLGDLILTTGFIRRVREKNPDSRISILVNKGAEDVLAGNPHLNDVIILDKKKIKSSIFGFFKFASEIRARKFDTVLSPHFSHRSSILSFLSGAGSRIGYHEAGFSFLLNRRISRPLHGKHEVEKLFSLIGEENSPYRPELYLPSDRIQNIEKIFKEEIGGRKYIVLAPSSVWETKRMPEDKFRRILELILEKTDYLPVLTGAPKDRELCASIGKGFEAADLTGRTNLVELHYVISKSAGIVSNDSSPIHIASAFNIPIAAVFGATVKDFGYTPLSDKQFIAEISGLKCRPCGIHGGNVCPEKHFRCMREQNPENIFEELMKLLSP
ncbi:MAG TPA: glycosyltransferase family 9 protein [Leptospiraceae bacterium]|nr:glycosyltransferase family 9 protein [Leptospiraceae bacterium]HMY65035.1 glycosyltransferase family 9 protein [Leptospiraceae bacterium]HMZ59472.1 glycosyltransferase family 9 protein [Leptospiraceae bacterium]HNF12721.1 glycosyltransferase family 9 protein [Leptospiraceae bacterium]HNF22858.1 glycosyltransferase family 9 protein [Leptospiraceae bacterium]